MKIFFSFLVFPFILFSSNKIVAIVGDDIILKTDVEEMVFLQQSQGVDVGEENVLDGMIEQKVLVYFARKDSTLVVDENQLNDMVSAQLNSYKEQFGGSVEALEKYFDKSFSQIFDFLYEQGEDVFLANQLKQKLFSQVSVSSSEVKDFYLTERDFLEPLPPLYSYSCFSKPFSISEKRKEKIKALADSVLIKINQGEEFSSFYSSFSGGKVEFKRGDFGLPEFEWAAFSLKNKGDITPPVLTSLGYHLIELDRRLGEKVIVNHILFPLSLSLEDKEESISFVEKQRVSSFENLFFLDSLCRKQSFLDKGGFSGVFTKAPDYLISPEVFSALKSLSVESFSETIELKDASFFVYLSEKTPPAPPSLEDNWEQLEWLVLQKKFNTFFTEWYNKKRGMVYIKKYSLIP